MSSQEASLILGSYNHLKTVKNICPSCGTHAVYKVRYIYSDEGHMVCSACRLKAIEDKEESLKEKMSEAKRAYIRSCPDGELRELIIELFELSREI